jgi:hypothetical protein
MATVYDSLKSINAYPIPTMTIKIIAEARELTPEISINKYSMLSKNFRLAKADLLMWLSLAPDVKQEDISYNFNEQQRTDFKNQAAAIYEEAGEETDKSKTIYGYKGSRL